MFRILLLLSAALACTAAAAQNYSGTFTTTNSQGGMVTLMLQQDGPKHVTGTLSGNNATFQVQGEITPQGLMGAVTGAQGNLYMMAQYEGANLVVLLAEPGPTGQPNIDSARRVVFSRAGASKPPAPRGG